MLPRFRLRSLMAAILLIALVLGVATAIARMDTRDRPSLNRLAFLLGPVVALVLIKVNVAIALRRKRYRLANLKTLDDDPIRPRTGG